MERTSCSLQAEELRQVSVTRVLWLICCLLWLVAGCASQDDWASVKGRVTVDGKPVEGLVVEFQPLAEGGSPSAAITDSDGRYQLMFTFKTPGVQPGEHLVTIRSADAYYEEDSAKAGGKAARSSPKRLCVQRRVTVKPGDNTIDFDL